MLYLMLFNVFLWILRLCVIILPLLHDNKYSPICHQFTFQKWKWLIIYKPTFYKMYSFPLGQDTSTIFIFISPGQHQAEPEVLNFLPV